MKKYILGLFVFVSAGASAGYLSQFGSSTHDLLTRMLAPFQAGYGYTEEQKNIARKYIVKLKKEYRAIKDSSRFFENEDALQKIKHKIHALQIVTGDEWSEQRKMVFGAIALLGVSALAFGVYHYVHHESSEIDQMNVSGINAPEIEGIGPNILEQASDFPSQFIVESSPSVLSDNLLFESPELRQAPVQLKSSEEAQEFLNNLFRGIDR